ncbi:MAG: PHB depolymerase family esterase [bacterium]|nr:PHB depolymerase family esterase [bacterium]MDZ4296152.1 PHB depolymerase family esterase [Patescibacteria group bacterium]
MSHLRLWLTVILIVVLATGIAWAASKKGVLRTALGRRPLPTVSQGIPDKPGDWRQSLIVDGRTRTYLLRIPQGYSTQQRYPLVAVFHGGGGSGEKIAAQTGFAAKADQEGFIAVFPDGVRHNWNDGRDTTDAYKQGVDDIAFVRALIARLSGEFPVDPKRIYAAGVSNGGIFSHRLACEMADVFAAVGPVVGPIATKLAPRCNPSGPVALVGIQGVADPGIPINGGEQGGFGGLGDGGVVESAAATMQFWAQKNGCAREPRVTDIPPRVNDGTRVTHYAYEACRGNGTVHYYVVEGMGHGWPPKRPQAPRLAGPTSQNISATDVIWEFFKSHPKP